MSLFLLTRQTSIQEQAVDQAREAAQQPEPTPAPTVQQNEPLASLTAAPAQHETLDPRAAVKGKGKGKGKEPTQQRALVPNEVTPAQLRQTLHQLGNSVHAKLTTIIEKFDRLENTLLPKLDSLAEQVDSLHVKTDLLMAMPSFQNQGSPPGLQLATPSFQLQASQPHLSAATSSSSYDRPPPPPIQTRENPCEYKGRDWCDGVGLWGAKCLAKGRKRYPLICTSCYHWLIGHQPPVLDMTYANGRVVVPASEAWRHQ
jgi:hypothetical protein